MNQHTPLLWRLLEMAAEFEAEIKTLLKDQQNLMIQMTELEKRIAEKEKTNESGKQ